MYISSFFTHSISLLPFSGNNFQKQTKSSAFYMFPAKRSAFLYHFTIS